MCVVGLLPLAHNAVLSSSDGMGDMYTSNTASSGNAGLSGGAIAGIVISVVLVVGIGVIVGVLVICWWR